VTARALLIEIDEALGHWLCAVLGEAGLEVDWQKDVDAARSALTAPGARFELCVVEGVIGGQGVELCAEAGRRGSRTILLIPRGGAVMQGVADRILEHPLTRTGLSEAVRALNVIAADEEPPPVELTVGTAQPENTEEMRVMAAAEDRLRLGRAALQEGNFEAAVIELEAAAALAPHDLRPKIHGKWARYGKVRAALREAKTLAAELDRLLEVAPSADAHYYAAAMAHDAGDNKRAKAELDKAIALDAEHADARQLAEIISGR
jgi:tetratricopeptide (TPR) repeat protein